MARPRRISDATVHEAVLSLIRVRGEKAVTFSAVAERAGLAASSLAERHGSIAGLIADTRAGQWQRLETATEAALALAPLDAKGALVLLKTLRQELPPLGTDPARALRWRERLEAALALRLGGGTKGREAALILFAVWQGQGQWIGVADSREIRLKSVLKRLMS